MTNPINLPSVYRDAIKSELINNHDAAPVNRVLADPEITLEEMKTLTPDEKAKFRAAIAAQKSVIGDETHASLEALLVESEKNPGVSQVATVASVVPSSGYTRGPLKQAQNPENDLERLTGNETAQKMGETIKKNITLLQTRVRTNYIRHFDDALLGSVVSFRDEYEHYGRVLTNGLAQIGTPGFTIDADKGTGDNVVNYSNTGASELIDSLVSQYGNGSKELQFQRGFQKKPFNSAAEKDQEILAKLQEINEGLLDEDGWLGLTIGLPIGLYITAKVTVPIMKWGIGKVPFVGKPAVALTEEMYEKIERAAKGVGGSGKSLAQSVKNRLLAKKAEGAGDKELSDSQKELKKVQTEGAKEVVKEFLFEKYGSTYSNYDAFIKDLDSGGVASSSQIRQARQEMSSLNTTISKHLPVDVSLMDGWELEMKLRQIGLDMPLGVWGRMKNTMYRFLFEKGAVSNLVFQNKYVRLSERTNSGSYTDKVTDLAGGLAKQVDRVEIELSNGEKVSVIRADEKLIKEVMQHVDSEVARDAVRTEMTLKSEIHVLETKIKRLKADGIPDTEQGVKELEDKLLEAKRRYAEFEALHQSAESARKNRSQADTDVENAKSELELKQGLKDTAKANLDTYVEYGEAKVAYDKLDTEKATKVTKVSTTRGALSRAIELLESTINSKSSSIPFTKFSAAIDEIDFTEKAEQHLRELSSKVTNYNGAPNIQDVDKLNINEIFGDVNNKITAVDTAEAELKIAKTTLETAKTTLDTKIQALKDINLWDIANNKPSVDQRTLKSELVAAEAEVKKAEAEVKKAEAEAAKKAEAVKKVTGKIGADSVMKGVVNKPTSVDGTGKTHAIKTQAELGARVNQAGEMKQSITGRDTKSGKLPEAETARVEAVRRAGIPEASIAKLKPKADGTLDAEGNRVLQELIDKTASTQTSFDTWKSRLPAGYTTEIRDQKLVVKDSAGLPKGTLDPSKPAEAAKLLEKLTKR